jgi:hypothetical protein
MVVWIIITKKNSSIGINIIPMLINSDYSPAGPLIYLLMDKKGHSKLGLYQHKKSGSIVLAGQFLGKQVIFWPGASEPNRCLEEKITLSYLLNNSKRTFPALSMLKGLFNKIISLNIWLLFNNRLSDQKYYLIYPNFYYVYRESLFNQSLIKITL